MPEKLNGLRTGYLEAIAGQFNVIGLERRVARREKVLASGLLGKPFPKLKA
jgi:hypothetical protein